MEQVQLEQVQGEARGVDAVRAADGWVAIAPVADRPDSASARAAVNGWLTGWGLHVTK